MKIEQSHCSSYINYTICGSARGAPGGLAFMVLALDFEPEGQTNPFEALQHERQPAQQCGEQYAD